jgi:hypothetical protein
MDFHLDGLLNLPDITIERCIKNDTKTILKVSFLDGLCYLSSLSKVQR